ncbi:hypothetical protein O6H91_14G055500 [Diphasiastrum complanatum]|uniref:Uncharacterized protein n=1 Tax=Diphasiastrum complanatum TaxID=34168 RepID=A0ACC2BPU8_DIPCM|nr:hypothetical protein O6H91_14G055500 [Diphasiastrum complanatum]
MLLTDSAVDALGVVTLVLVILLCCLSFFSVAYLLHFRSKVHKDNYLTLREFNSFWIIRLILILCALFWGLVELLRLPLLRREGWLLHSLGIRWQANVCRIYILSSFGITKPCFFLTALFLAHGSLRSTPFTPRKGWNGRVVTLMLLFGMPVFLLQFFLVIFTPIIEFRKGYEVSREGYGVLPYYFTQSFEEVQMDNHRVAICTYPLLSTAVLGVLGCVYIGYFLYLGWRMLSLVINRKLQLRIYTLVLAIVLLLPFHFIFMGLSVLSPPTQAIYEVLSFMGFLTILFCTGLGEGILVIRPIADALAVQWVFDSSLIIKKESTNGDSTVHRLIRVDVVSSDEDIMLVSELSYGKKVLRHSEQDSADTDLEDVDVAGYVLNDPKDEDRSSTFAEWNGATLSPAGSPALPGKPLISYVNKPCL